MTRVLYWNIQNFSLPKITRPAADPLAFEATDRFDHIVDWVIEQTEPDMIVIVEVFARTHDVANEGVTLPPGLDAGRATNMLLERLRAPGDPWFLVPPIMVGQFGKREAVAVYFRSDKLQFTGPYVWCELAWPNDYLAARPPNLARAQPYFDWDGALPRRDVTRSWRAGGTTVLECQSAAQWCYFDAGGRPLRFPDPTSRGPYHTRFRDQIARRTLKVFTVHTSPDQAAAAVAVIPSIQELAVANDEVSLVIGDFNVDSFESSGTYDGLRATHRMLFESEVGGQVDQSRKKYLMTHLLPTDKATRFNATGLAVPDPQHNVYPRYGYQGSQLPNNTVTDSGAIDNAFVRYGANFTQPAPTATVVNTVVGVPFNAAPPAPVGAVDVTPAVRPQIPQGGINSAGLNTDVYFQRWFQFGKIHSVSDHLALVVDI